MLNKIIQFSLQNRLLVLVASVLLLIGGTYTAFHTEVDVFPDLNAPTVVVMTEANGMAAEEVEQSKCIFMFGFTVPRLRWWLHLSVSRSVPLSWLV